MASEFISVIHHNSQLYGCALGLHLSIDALRFSFHEHGILDFDMTSFMRLRLRLDVAALRSGWLFLYVRASGYCHSHALSVFTQTVPESNRVRACAYFHSGPDVQNSDEAVFHFSMR